jgi:hypothetical protein
MGQGAAQAMAAAARPTTALYTSSLLQHTFMSIKVRPSSLLPLPAPPISPGCFKQPSRRRQGSFMCMQQCHQSPVCNCTSYHVAQPGTKPT